MAVDERRIAIIGAGKIGEALLAGLLSTGWRSPGEIVVTVRREERFADLARTDDRDPALVHSHAPESTRPSYAASRW